VYIRPSGQTLKKWKRVDEAGELQRPYAWASAAAYQDPDDPGREGVKLPEKCQGVWPREFLTRQGWILWDTLPLLKPHGEERPEYKLEGQTLRQLHLRAEVWANEQRKEVIVAFGGTVGSNLLDWKANSRWFLKLVGGGDDQYDAVTKYFVPIFRKEYERRAQSGEAWLKDGETRVVVTGHSLGGGLAQRFAYEIFFSKDIPFGKKVVAFDPSPVSGKRDSDTYKKYKDDVVPYRGLEIDRIYNRGEILATVRSILSWGNPDPGNDEQGQSWTDFRYKDDWSLRVLLPSGSVHAHGISDLACFMTPEVTLKAIASK
jgi:hypothetical protein